MPDRLEKIDLIKERAHVSFQEAKEALEKNDYDVIETLVDLERQGKLKDGSSDDKEKASQKKKSHYEKTDYENEAGSLDKIKEIIKKVFESHFIVRDKKGSRVLKLPFPIAALIIILTMPMSILVLILAVLFKFKLIIGYNDGKTTVINEIIDDLNEEYDSRKEKKQAEKESSDPEVQDAQYKIKTEDGENEKEDTDY